MRQNKKNQSSLTIVISRSFGPNKAFINIFGPLIIKKKSLYFLMPPVQPGWSPVLWFVMSDTNILNVDALDELGGDVPPLASPTNNMRSALNTKSELNQNWDNDKTCKVSCKQTKWENKIFYRFVVIVQLDTTLE